MTALVVYESMFGSTKAVAEAVAAGLHTAMPVEVVEVGELAATQDGGSVDEEVTLLVVGGPTHAFSMSRASTREDAGKEAPPQGLVSTGVGIREWIETLSVPKGLLFAAFDTKVATPHLPGSAAKAAAKRLHKKGGTPAVAAQSFAVNGKADGLVEGELEAARAWGRALGSTVATAR